MGYTVSWDFLDFSSVKLLGSLVTELAVGYRATISRVFLSILEGGRLPADQLAVSVPFLVVFCSLSLTSLLTGVLFSKIQSESLRPVMLPPSSSYTMLFAQQFHHLQGIQLRTSTRPLAQIILGMDLQFRLAWGRKPAQRSPRMAS